MTSCTLLSAHLDYPIISRPTHVLYIRKCLQVYFWSRGLDLIASRGVTRDSSQTKSSLLLGPPMLRNHHETTVLCWERSEQPR